MMNLSVVLWSIFALAAASPIIQDRCAHEKQWCLDGAYSAGIYVVREELCESLYKNCTETATGKFVGQFFVNEYSS